VCERVPDNIVMVGGSVGEWRSAKRDYGERKYGRDDAGFAVVRSSSC
jgi:hypothetical protein